MDIPYFLIAAAGASVFSLLFVIYLAKYVLSKPEGNDEMARLSLMVQEGARAFLRQEYRYVGGFVVVIAGLITGIGFVKPELGLGWETAVAFAMGAVASAVAGFLGMNIATRANSRTAAAAGLFSSWATRAARNSKPSSRARCRILFP